MSEILAKKKYDFECQGWNNGCTDCCWDHRRLDRVAGVGAAKVWYIDVNEW